MGLSDVEIRGTTNWKALFLAVIVAILGNAISAVLAFSGQIGLGVIVSIVCTVVGIFIGLKIQANELVKSMRVSGSGTGSAKAAVVISQRVTGSGVGRATARVVPHSRPCAQYESSSQAIGKIHYEIPIQVGEQCTCSCHQPKSNTPNDQP